MSVGNHPHRIALGVLAFLILGAAAMAEDDPPRIRSTPELKIEGIALPGSWKEEPEKEADTHTDAEWQAPSGETVFGAVYLHVPPLVSGKSLIKEVQKNYVKRQSGGKMTSQWTDGERHWFEVDADGTHSKGFVIAHDGHAWLVYYRYGAQGHSPQPEIDVADHAINHVNPTT